MMKTDLFGSLQKERLEKISKRGVLPCFQNISTTVEVRSVVEKDYNLEKPASEYEPKIISRIPIISIDIRTDSGNDQHLYFQASIEEASAIIQELLASIKIAEKTMAKK